MSATANKTIKSKPSHDAGDNKLKSRKCIYYNTFDTAHSEHGTVMKMKKTALDCPFLKLWEKKDSIGYDTKIEIADAPQRLEHQLCGRKQNAFDK